VILFLHSPPPHPRSTPCFPIAIFHHFHHVLPLSCWTTPQPDRPPPPRSILTLPRLPPPQWFLFNTWVGWPPLPRPSRRNFSFLLDSPLNPNYSYFPVPSLGTLHFSPNFPPPKQPDHEYFLRALPWRFLMVRLLSRWRLFSPSKKSMNNFCSPVLRVPLDAQCPQEFLNHHILFSTRTSPVDDDTFQEIAALALFFHPPSQTPYNLAA